MMKSSLLSITLPLSMNKILAFETMKLFSSKIEWIKEILMEHTSSIPFKKSAESPLNVFGDRFLTKKGKEFK